MTTARYFVFLIHEDYQDSVTYHLVGPLSLSYPSGLERAGYATREEAQTALERLRWMEPYFVTEKYGFYA